jgi:hypothetical protein
MEIMSYPYSSLRLESRWARLKLTEEIRSALGLLHSALEIDGKAPPHYPMDHNTSFVDGAGI